MVDFEGAVKADPRFAAERQLMLRNSLGLDSPGIQCLLNDSEFVSLGGFCGVSAALEALGLRKSAGPFDWVRCPVEGVVHCFENNFRDFLSFSTTRMEHGHKVFESTPWHGSFWHHDIDESTVQDQFHRRIERLVGTKQVQNPASRFFVRVANSKAELGQASKLLTALQKKFHASSVYLLIIADMQKQDRLVHVKGTSHHLLFHSVHENLWLNSSPDSQSQMKQCSEAYAACIGAAIRYWAQGLVDEGAAWVCDATFEGWMTTYNGGDPAKDSYSPQGKPPGYICVPQGTRSGHLIRTNAFGKDVEIVVPEGANEGNVLELRLFGDVLSVRLVPDDAVATAALALMGVTTAAAAATTTTNTNTSAPSGLALQPGPVDHMIST